MHWFFTKAGRPTPAELEEKQAKANTARAALEEVHNRLEQAISKHVPAGKVIEEQGNGRS